VRQGRFQRTEVESNGEGCVDRFGKMALTSRCGTAGGIKRGLETMGLRLEKRANRQLTGCAWASRLETGKKNRSKYTFSLADWTASVFVKVTGHPMKTKKQQLEKS
jgi:hypothetical protein